MLQELAEHDDRGEVVVEVMDDTGHELLLLLLGAQQRIALVADKLVALAQLCMKLARAQQRPHADEQIGAVCRLAQCWVSLLGIACKRW